MLPRGSAARGHEQTVPHVGQVRVEAQLPGVAVGLDHLRLAGQVLVVVVFDVALADEGLEVGAEFTPYGGSM